MYTTKKLENKAYEIINVDEMVFYKLIETGNILGSEMQSSVDNLECKLARKESEVLNNVIKDDDFSIANKSINISNNESAISDNLIQTAIKENKISTDKFNTGIAGNNIANEINKHDAGISESVDCFKSHLAIVDNLSAKNKETQNLNEAKSDKKTENSLVLESDSSINLDISITKVKNNLNLHLTDILTKVHAPAKKVRLEEPKRKRYSDQFKDPVFIQRDVYRKLKMMECFYERHNRLDKITDNFKLCISECIEILRKEFDIPPITIFDAFKLSDYGFDKKEYGIDSDEEEIDRQVYPADVE